MDTNLNETPGIVVNSCKTTPNFKLERGLRLGDPIRSYVFIIVLEVVFSLTNANIGIEIFHFF